MAEKVFRKLFGSVGGLNLVVSDIDSDNSSFSELKNVFYEQQGKILVTSTGAKIRAPNGQYTGLYKATYADSSTGEVKEKLLSLSDNLYVLTERTFTINYLGSSSYAVFSLLLDETTFTFKAIIVENIASVFTTIFNFDLGTGLENSFISVGNGAYSGVPYQSLLEAVNDPANTYGMLGRYTASTTGAGTGPAAFLPIMQVQDLAHGAKTLSITYYEWVAANTTATTPFATYFGKRGEDYFELASTKNMEDCLYIATGWEYLHKWDGQNVYRAGLPDPLDVNATPLVSATNGAGGLTGTYRYVGRYRQDDNRSNSHYSNLTPITTDLTDAANQNLITVKVPDSTSFPGFMTHGANVNGAQAGITTSVTVNAGHTVVVGDTIYLIDQSASSKPVVTRLITSIGATTLTWAVTTAINVSANDLISVGTVFELYRNKNGGSTFYLVLEKPINWLVADHTLSFNEDLADANLGAELIYSLKNPDLLAIKPRYITEHQGLMVVAGAVSETNSVRFSNADDIEGFDGQANELFTPSTDTGPITGLISDYEQLVVGKPHTLYGFAGDLDSGAVIPQLLGDGALGIGCHNSVGYMGYGAIFLSNIGFRRIAHGNIEPLGAQLDPFFINTPLSSLETFQLKRSIATLDPNQRRYYCFVPCESGTSTGKYTNDNSRIFWYDWSQDKWGSMVDYDAGGGMVLFNDMVTFQSRRSDPLLTVTGNLWLFHSTNSKYDYALHQNPIEVEMDLDWDSFGEPSQLKKFLYVKLFNLKTDTVKTPFDIHLETEIDFVRGAPHSVTDLSFDAFTGGGWGFGTWGGFVWGHPTPRSRITKLRGKRVTALRILLSNDNIHQKISLAGVEYVLSVPYRRELKE